MERSLTKSRIKLINLKRELDLTQFLFDNEFYYDDFSWIKTDHENYTIEFKNNSVHFWSYMFSCSIDNEPKTSSFEKEDLVQIFEMLNEIKHCNSAVCGREYQLEPSFNLYLADGIFCVRHSEYYRYHEYPLIYLSENRKTINIDLTFRYHDNKLFGELPKDFKPLSNFPILNPNIKLPDEIACKYSK